MLQRNAMRILMGVSVMAGLTWVVLRNSADSPAWSMLPEVRADEPGAFHAYADERTPALTPLAAGAADTCPNTVKWVRELTAWGVREEDAKNSLQEQARKLLEPARGGIIMGEQPTDFCKKHTCADVDGKKVACVVDGVLEEDAPCQKRKVKGKLLKSDREATFEIYWCTGKLYYGCFCEQ